MRYTPLVPDVSVFRGVKHKALEAKAKKFDCEFQKKCAKERDYEKPELYLMELLMDT